MSQLSRQSPNQQYMWGFNAPHRCAHCKLRFVDEGELNLHHRRQHGLKLLAVENWNADERCYGPVSAWPSKAARVIDFNCLLCDQQSTSWIEISQHIADAHSRRVCTCCGRLFANEAALKSHRRNMHDAARANMGGAEVVATSAASYIEASATNEPTARADNNAGKATDEVPTASPAQVDCSICQMSQTHPQDSGGAFSCAHCAWTSLSVSRLKRHHLEMHDQGEYAQLWQGTSAPEVGPEACDANTTRDDLADQDSGRSSRAESPIPTGGSNASKISKAAVGPAEGGASTDNKKRKETRSAKRNLEIACPSCNFTGPTLRSIRLHNISEHAGVLFHDPEDREKKGASRKQSASTKSRHTPGSKAKARHAIEERQASDDSRSKKSFTAHGYQQDGFVCSDRSSLESDDEDSSTLTPALSPHSDADASWHPSERSGEDTVQEEEEDSGSGVDNEESHLSCERCQESFVSKLGLAIHMSRSHRVSFFCTYCFRGAKRVDILRLHHEREHRQLPFLYRTLDKLRLVTVGVDSDESDENTVASERPIGRSIRHPTRHRHRIVPKSVPRSSSRQSSIDVSPSEQHDSAPWRRKRPRLLSSTSDEATDCYDLETAVPTILRCVYYGYRCTKSVRAFHQLVANISDEFKCSAFSCGFSTNSSSDFENHLKSHDLTDVFCMYCGTSVASPGALLTHLQVDHSDLRLQCCKCLYRTARNMHFSIHFPQAHPQDTVASVPLSSHGDPVASNSTVKIKEFSPYICGISGCLFSNRKRYEFEKHFEEAHSNADSYPCGICRKSCQSVGALLEHFHDHGFADIECGYCTFGTENTGTMMLHACYCHSSHLTMFRVRSDNLSQQLITSSDQGIKYETSYDLSHLTFQQRCCFCPALVTGFEDFQRHVSGKHNLVLSVHELADKLFMLYDYTEAVQHGQCPFCSFAVDDVGRLQQHVLKQELCITTYVCSACRRGFDDQLSWQKHIDNGRCSSSATLQVCENGPLLSWVQQNLAFKFQRFGCCHCAQVFNVASTFRSHLQRHYTYYPALCKICDQSFRGINAKEAHMRAAHGGSGLTKGEEIDVDAEVARQSVLRVLHTCRRCGFQTFSQAYIEMHREKCSASEGAAPALQASGDRSERSNATTEEEEDVPAYYCMQCSVGFMYLERLLSHGFTQHGCDYFCSVCYRGFQTKEHFTRHCRSRTCRRPPSVFRVEVVKRSSQRKFFYRELFIDYDVGNGAYSSSGEDDELEECYYSFYKQDYEPVQGISRTYITAETEMKLSVSDIAQVMNIEPYVCVRDWKKTLF
uniref:KRAB domain-containing zinc finger protein n=1 Tax=Rhipicephalus appendiculatus TaxID=34631 RepID=A0A131YT85_RHIAP